MMDARLLMWVDKRNAPEGCASLRPPEMVGKGVFGCSANWDLSNSQTEIYLFLYVATIPTTKAKKVIGASLTNKNSNPCIIVPA
ncbi:MAG: hypothetical protein J6A48_07305, partial [Clostridia bacterium]|nr:hypothetical protein [Clostridia bacterium]